MIIPLKVFYLYILSIKYIYLIYYIYILLYIGIKIQNVTRVTTFPSVMDGGGS